MNWFVLAQLAKEVQRSPIRGLEFGHIFGVSRTAINYTSFYGMEFLTGSSEKRFFSMGDISQSPSIT
jgi:hypothetical protein